MNPYILCFFASFLFFHLAEKSKRNKFASGFLGAIGIAILCSLAGLRSENIGTDIQAYVKPIYTAANNSNSFGEYLTSSWYSLWRYKHVSDFEIGFTSLVYIIAKVFNSFSAVLFSIEFCIITPIYFALKKMFKRKKVSFGMLVFCLMFYNVTLNIMRQWIAMAFVLYAFSCIITKERGKAVISIIAGTLFHVSAIISIPIFGIFFYVSSRKTSGKYKIKRFRVNNFSITLDRSMQRTIIVLIIGLILIIFINSFANILRSIGLSEYAQYISGGAIFSINAFIVRLPILIIFLKYKYIFTESNLNSSFYMGMLLFDILTSQLSGITSQSWRISAWFSMFYIFSFPQLINGIQRKSEKKIVLVLVFLYMIFYWLYYFVYIGSHSTIPYEFGV